MKLGILIPFILFVILAYAAVPLMIKLFVSGHVMIGNADSSIIVWLKAHQREMTLAVWVVWTLGLGIALPTMMKDGFFSGNL